VRQPANLSTVPVCLPVHVVTKKKNTSNTKNTGKYIKVKNQHFHSTTVSQYSATRNKHTHPRIESPAKMPGGRDDNWLYSKERPLYRGETES
jgi:hypothetical protein